MQIQDAFPGACYEISRECEPQLKSVGVWLIGMTVSKRTCILMFTFCIGGVRPLVIWWLINHHRWISTPPVSGVLLIMLLWLCREEIIHMDYPTHKTPWTVFTGTTSYWKKQTQWKLLCWYCPLYIIQSNRDTISKTCYPTMLEICSVYSCSKRSQSKPGRKGGCH